MTVLQVSNLTVTLPAGGDRPKAIEGVSFEIERNEILCLVGESGSGKSVIAQAIMGLLPKSLPITHGEVRVEGKAPTREMRGARMAMIFQEPMSALNPVMRCGEQIDEVFRAHTRLSASARKGKSLSLLREVALSDPERIRASYPHQLSGGQRQRTMIAMALALEPALLIADEPTTALDVTTQAQILKLILDLQKAHGMAVLFVTHDFGVVAEIAHRVAVLREGRLVEVGTRSEVLTRPRDDYTRMLIHSVPTLQPRARTSAPAAATVLEAKALSKTYIDRHWLRRNREVAAVWDVDLVVRKGETLGLVGESGSGKSTVARCIARLIEPSGGEIRLGGTDLARLPARALRPMRRRVQVIFQDPYRSLNPRRSVGEALIEGPLNFGVPRAQALERARRLMELVRMDPQSLARYPHQFSGGQRQRICIARALAVEPELLVADEPVSALDVSVQAQVLALFEEIRQRLDLAMLFITHDLRVAAQVCDRVAVMHEGRVVECGPASEVLVRPQHAYTQALIAAAPGRGFAFASQ
ncbi:MAG: peptide/nickel transport system ATP-binding protein ddpF [Betaproteobacteria bacterium]|jgi:peptide/nickel transport system ATP-binding protein|nr:peptide/nickel transport system ATP-binding protein ddpF [Betaproteobacteria bacterium]